MRRVRPAGAGLALLAAAGIVQAQADPQAPEWISLFNGRDLAGWTVKIHHHDVGRNYGDTFRVEDGLLKVRYDEYGDFNEQFGHIFYDRPFSYYHLVVEYRLVGDLHPGAPDFAVRNNGVMLHAQDPRTMPREQDWPISIEFQFLGGLGDGRPRPTGNMCSPGTQIVYEHRLDTRHCINSSSATYDGDQWVRAEAVVLGSEQITHVINGDIVMRYSNPQIGGGVVQRYDPAIKQDGKLLTEGHIALQSEGQPIDFRRVELLNLKGCMNPAAVNYRSHYVAPDAGACRYAR